MRQLLEQDVLQGLWLAYALYWALSAVRQGRAKTDESQFALWLYVAICTFAFVLLFYLRDRIATLLIFLGLFYGVLAIVGRKQTKQRESLSTRLAARCSDDRRVCSLVRKVSESWPPESQVPP